MLNNKQLIFLILVISKNNYSHKVTVNDIVLYVYVLIQYIRDIFLYIHKYIVIYL